MISLLLTTAFVIDIKGEVNNPGVYETEKTTINETIKLAGGLTSAADTKNINLSMLIKDEMVIYIPNKNEKISCICNCPIVIYKKCNKKKKEIKQTQHEKVITKKPKEEKRITTKPVIVEDPIVNINTSPKDRLMTLNGIGDKTASNIIDYRTENPFKEIEDILNVKGIGQAIFAKIKDFITV